MKILSFSFLSCANVRRARADPCGITSNSYIFDRKRREKKFVGFSFIPDAKRGANVPIAVAQLQQIIYA